MGTFMGSKSPNDILNQWWANGVPLSGAGGATGTAVDLPVTAKVTTIGGATPLFTTGAQHVAIKTIGGATPTFTGGAQHMILTNASIQVDVTAAEITTLAGVTPTMIVGSLAVGVQTIGGATPTFTDGAQHFVLTGASTATGHYLGAVSGTVTLLPSISHIGSATVFLAAGDANFGNVDIVTLPALEQTTPALSAVTIAVPDTEYTQGLPANCRAVQFQCRTANDVRYAWATGKVATPVDPYFTLKSGAVYFKEGLKLTAATLHMAAAASVLYVEVEAWS